MEGIPHEQAIRRVLNALRVQPADQDDVLQDTWLLQHRHERLDEGEESWVSAARGIARNMQRAERRRKHWERMADG